LLDSVRDAFRLPDLKRRILFTIGVLFLFRLGAHIPTPGIDPDAMAQLFEGGGILGFLDIFAGGALRRFSIFALGVAPYINSSIVMQLLVVVIPALEKIQKEGEEGRKKIVQITRWGTIFFALIQAVGLTFWIGRVGIFSGTLFDGIVVVVTVTTGAVAVMWLGEELSDHGIGNGISLLIFAGIVARIPEAMVRTWKMMTMGEVNAFVMILALLLILVVVAGCIMLQEGQRRLPVQYAKRVVGNKMYGGQSTFIPLRVNQAGVIPIIFASSVLMFPYTIARFFSGDIAAFMQRILAPGSILYMILYVALII
jgi:preprotein translocase subunit SecY